MSNTRKIRIKPAVLATKDQSNQRKEFWYDGQAFVVQGIGQKVCPDYVASAWATHDSDVEIVTDPSD